jgi:hypothetical protein
MRCQNCDTMVLDSERMCPVCRQKVVATSGPKRPFFSAVFMILGAAIMGGPSLPDNARKSGIDWNKVLWAGVGGGIGGVIGTFMDRVFRGVRGPYET